VKTIVVTQEESLYLALFMGKVLAEYRDIIAIVTLPGRPKGLSIYSYIKRYYSIFGLRDSIIYGGLLIYHYLLNFLSYFVKLNRFYSVAVAAKKNAIPLYRMKNINSPHSISQLKMLEPEIIVSVAAPPDF